jgi:hypothetical protein
MGSTVAGDDDDDESNGGGFGSLIKRIDADEDLRIIDAVGRTEKECANVTNRRNATVVNFVIMV